MDPERKPSMGISSLLRAVNELHERLNAMDANLTTSMAALESRLQSFQDALSALNKRVEFIENG